MEYLQAKNQDPPGGMAHLWSRVNPIGWLAFRIAMVVLFLGGTVPCHGAMSLVFREMFDTTGRLNSQSTGSFSSVTGTFHQRAGGPRLAGSAAASADLQNSQAGARYNFADPQSPKVFVGAWFFMKSVADSQTILLSMGDLLGNLGPVISGLNGQLGAGVPYQSWTPCPIDPLNKWVYLGIGISRISGSTADVKFYYRLPGGPMNTWANITGGNIWLSSLNQFLVAFEGNNPGTEFRVGAPSAYAFEQADFSDIAYPTDLIEPVRGLTWYCNPVTGNDENDGTTPETAWASVSKVNTESQHTGMFPSDSYTTGDTLIIDTAEADLEVPGSGLVFRTEGLNVRAATGQTWVRLKTYKALASAGWAITSNPRVFSTTNTQANIVVWEDDKFMNHPTGANFAAVSAALGSTPGSFWTDGTTLYVHPFGNSDPRVDGKRYERSQLFDDAMAVVLAAPNLHIRDIHSGKTTLAEKSNNTAVQNYCMATRSHAGTTLIEHCYLYYGSNHNLGLVRGAAGDTVRVDGVQAEQASPYTTAGGQTVWVSFVDGPSNLGITHSYRNCVTHANAGLIGSTSGFMKGDVPVFYSHNAGGADQFAKFEFINCDFGNGGMQGDAVQKVDLTNTRCGGVQFGADVNLSRCFVEGSSLNPPGHTLTARNCIYVLKGMLTRNLFAGILDIRFCTFDASQITSIQGGVDAAALFSRAGPLFFTFRNNAVILPANAVSANVFSNLRSTDTLDLSSNAYRLGGNRLSFQYDDHGSVANLALPPWQARGFDVGSFDDADLKLLSYEPQPGSPLIGTAPDSGPSEDYTGTIYEVRNDIGAIEAPRSFLQWQVENFSAEEIENSPDVDPLAAYGADGVTNLLKYGLGLSPHGVGSSATPEVSVIAADGEGTPQVCLEYTRFRHVTDIGYLVEESTDLKSWTVAIGYEEILTSNADMETVRHVVSSGVEGRKFLRLRVSLQD